MADSYSSTSTRKFDEGKVTRDTDPGEEGRFTFKQGGGGSTTQPRRKPKDERLQVDDIKLRISKLKTAEERDALVALIRRKYGDDAVRQYEDGSATATVGGERISIPANDDFGMSDEEQAEWARRTPGPWHDNDGSAPSGGGSHTIAGGDTLSAIAKKYLGSAARWKEIYELNKQVIDAEAKKRGKEGGGHWIFPGTKLKIPGVKASASSDPVLATATKHWNAENRRKAAESGIALPDGSFPIRDKRDFEKAKRALGRASNKVRAVKHIIKRGKALGVPKEDYEGLLAALVADVTTVPLESDSTASLMASLRERVHSLTAAQWVEALHPRGRDGKFIEKGGWISGLVKIVDRFGDVGEKRVDRAKVIGMDENTQTGEVQLELEVPDTGPYRRAKRMSARASDVVQVASPKADLDVEEPGNQPSVGADVDAAAMWRNQFDAVTSQIPEEAISEIDGQPFINPAMVDAELLERYRRLLQAGYANGFLASGALTAADDINFGVQPFRADWDPTLHPRGRDGRFIETGGWIRGLVRLWDDSTGKWTGEKRDVRRGKVLGIRDDGGEKYTLDVEFTDENGDTQRGFATAADVVQIAGPKATLEEVDAAANRPRRRLKSGGLLDHVAVADKTDLIATEINADGVPFLVEVGGTVVVPGDPQPRQVQQIQAFSDGDMVRVDGGDRGYQWVKASNVRPYQYPQSVESQIQEAGRSESDLRQEGERVLAERRRNRNIMEETTPVDDIIGFPDEPAPEADIPEELEGDFDITNEERLKVDQLEPGMVIAYRPWGAYKGEDIIEITGNPERIVEEGGTDWGGGRIRPQDATWVKHRRIGKLEDDGSFTPAEGDSSLSVDHLSEYGTTESFRLLGRDGAMAQAHFDSLEPPAPEGPPANWLADMQRVTDALEAGDFLIEVEGQPYISPNAPPNLVALYQRLVQMGYANGWIT